MSEIATTVMRTGEVVSFETNSPEQIMDALLTVKAYKDAYEVLDKKLKKMAADIVDEQGRLEHDGHMLRVFTTQRMAYDPAVLREVFDEDELATFMEPSKGRIDAYIKEHLDDLGPMSTKLRQSMVPSGKPYTVCRLERLS